jgi:2-polyprenyl-3-methyl-5-hydroxy-6-metoxy-1,4-benzoquinol methylase
MNYRLAYTIGFHPWEDAEEQQGFVRSFSELMDEEESRRTPPYGRALDLGTGSGIWGVTLARRGWEVTGVDLVEKALERARERVAGAGVGMRVVRGDVTNLRAAGIEGGYDLALDTGTLHGLTETQRAAMGRQLDAVLSPEGTILLLAWQPKRRGPLPHGASREDIARAFPGWTVTELGPTGFEAPKPVEILMAPDERWYRLRRA